MNDGHTLAKEYFRYHYTNDSPRTNHENKDENDYFRGVAHNYIGYDPTINQFNRELLRYHHWPERKGYWSKVPRQSTQKGYTSEKGAIQFQNYDHMSRITAPFGTMDTPTISTKIIGSQYVPVIEGFSSQKPPGQSYAGQISITRLNDIPEKPNRVNPDILKKKAKGYHVQQDNDYEQMRQDTSSHGQPTYTGRQRPDSKSLNRGKRLPPLESNRNKNKTSTVFEQEVGMPLTNPLETETEYTDKYYTDGFRPISDGNFRSQMNGQAHHNDNDYPKALSDIGAPILHNRQSMSPIRQHQIRNGDVRTSDKRSELLRHLWNVGPDSIPQYPIQLSDKEEEILKQILIKELEGFPRRRLDSVHVEAITSDRDKNGTCPLMTLKKGLERQGAKLDSDTVRLVAAKYVDPNHHGWIFYQDFIRYIKKLMKDHEKLSIEKQEQEAYQHRHDSPMNDLSPIYHQPFGKLQQIAKQQLLHDNHMLNLNGIRQSFEERDSPFRGKLSEEQIMEVMYEHNVPLQRNLISRLLNIKCKRVGDEQYDWQAFCDILETIQADATGLPIPTSKRPLEYARHLPEPTDQWPRQRPIEPNHYHEGPPSYRHQSPMHHEQHRFSPQREPPFATQNYWPSNGPNPKFPPIRSNNTPLNSRTLQDEIEKLENELKTLQQRNEELLRNRANESHQILLAITSLSKDLYGIDEYKYGSCGRCHFKEVMEETEKRKLPIKYEHLADAAQRCCNHKGMVDIDQYLRLVKTMLHDYN